MKCPYEAFADCPFDEDDPVANCENCWRILFV